MKKRKTLAFMLVAGALMASVTSCGESKPQEKDAYTFTYDVNYEGGKNRVETIQANKKASYWRAKRSGYKLENWYTEKDGTTTFDFNTPITSDITVYAKWEVVEEVVPCTVIFDYNFENSDAPVNITVNKGEKIDASSVPSGSRLGYNIEGWYTEKECTNKFDISATPVSGDMTLYAKYAKDENLKFDKDGNLIFENVEFKFFINNDLGIAPYIKALANKFNNENNGKVKATFLDKPEVDSPAMSYMTLEFAQSEFFGQNHDDYYNIQDVMELAGLDLGLDDFYEGAIQTNYYGNKLSTMPIANYVPYAMYNKELMKKYNGDNPLPTNFKEFKALFEKVNKGEKETNTSWTKALVTDSGWNFKEITSPTIYHQNDTALYHYKNGKYINTWKEDKTELAKFVNAGRVVEEYFLPTSELGTSSSDYPEITTLSDLGRGNAFMGIIGHEGGRSFIEKGAQLSSIGLLDKFGVMPLSGLFAYDETNPNKDKVFAKGYSAGIRKTGPNDLYKVCGAAKFAEYVSKNMLKLNKNNFYPVRKSVYTSDAFQNSSNPEIKNYMKNFGKPENFITLRGHKKEYEIFNNKNTEIMTSLMMEDAFVEENVKNIGLNYSEVINALL